MLVVENRFFKSLLYVILEKKSICRLIYLILLLLLQKNKPGG